MKKKDKYGTALLENILILFTFPMMAHVTRTVC